MTKEYYNSPLSLYNIKDNTNNLSTTGTKRPPITTGEPLDNEEHSIHKTIVGKLLWMRPLRPDIQYATKELTRAVQKPNQHDKQNAKHLLRYLHGTRNYKLHLKPNQQTTIPTSRPTVTTTGHDALHQESRLLAQNYNLRELQLRRVQRRSKR
eukprot:4999111-Amphidinium_carterae.1